jgi:hypothetical protein
MGEVVRGKLSSEHYKKSIYAYGTVGDRLGAWPFAGIMACLELGYRLGCRHSKQTAHEGIGAIEAAVFALLGLLLAFSFGGGTSRLDTRRQLIIEEANAIGTAYLRLDMLARTDQPEMRRLFREYLNARLQVYQKLPDSEAAEQQMKLAGAIQQKLWSQAVNASLANPTPAVALLVLPAINQMIDVTTSRRVALYTHLPSLVLVMLMMVALFSGLLAGYTMAKRASRSWLHTVVYAFVVSVTIYAVIDLDYPRSGLIRLDAADNALEELRDSIR